jgi:hypothetical protein
MIKCSECGYENMDGLDYCDGCGAKLETPAAHPAGSPSAPSATAESGATAAASEPAAVHASEPTAAHAVAAAEAPASADEAGTSVTVSSAEPAAEEPDPSKAPTGEMHAGAAAPVAGAEVAGAPFKAKLSIIRGGRRGQEFELESGNNLVGRWDPETGAFPEVDLDADDPEAKVSRKHALIRLDAGKITIEDIGSLNGTYVNRQPRLQPGSPLDLKNGDEIIIGKTFLKLSINPVS